MKFEDSSITRMYVADMKVVSSKGIYIVLSNHYSNRTKWQIAISGQDSNMIHGRPHSKSSCSKAQKTRNGVTRGLA